MGTKPRILVVEQNCCNRCLLEQFLESVGYLTLTGADLEDLDRILEGREDINAALVDVVGFDPRVWQRCARLGERRIPFLVIASGPSRMLLREGIACGARGLLIKPVPRRMLLEALRGLVKERR